MRIRCSVEPDGFILSVTTPRKGLTRQELEFQVGVHTYVGMHLPPCGYQECPNSVLCHECVKCRMWPGHDASLGNSACHASAACGRSRAASSPARQALHWAASLPPALNSRMCFSPYHTTPPHASAKQRWAACPQQHRSTAARAWRGRTLSTSDATTTPHPCSHCHAPHHQGTTRAPLQMHCSNSSVNAL